MTICDANRHRISAHCFGWHHPTWSLHEPGAQSRKFDVADRSCCFQPVELFNFIGGAETHHAPELVTRVLGLLDVPIGHASSLKDQIDKNAEVWKHDPGDHPDCLDPA